MRHNARPRPAKNNYSSHITDISINGAYVTTTMHFDVRGTVKHTQQTELRASLTADNQNSTGSINVLLTYLLTGDANDARL